MRRGTVRVAGQDASLQHELVVSQACCTAPAASMQSKPPLQCLLVKHSSSAFEKKQAGNVQGGASDTAGRSSTAAGGSLRSKLGTTMPSAGDFLPGLCQLISRSPRQASTSCILELPRSGQLHG